MDNDKPKCPVCGREMRCTVEAAWRCEHGKPPANWEDGIFRGPEHDPSGSKVRAQIAAMQQQWQDQHPHTHPLDKDPESHLGVEPQPAPATCAEEVERHGRLRPDTTPSKPATCAEEVARYGRLRADPVPECSENCQRIGTAEQCAGCRLCDGPQPIFDDLIFPPSIQQDRIYEPPSA